MTAARKSRGSRSSNNGRKPIDGEGRPSRKVTEKAWPKSPMQAQAPGSPYEGKNEGRDDLSIPMHALRMSPHNVSSRVGKQIRIQQQYEVIGGVISLPLALCSLKKKKKKRCDLI